MKTIDKQSLKANISNALALSDCPLNSKLKSEDRLVAELGVSRRYLRESIEELTREGFLKRQRPFGTFLINRPPKMSEEEFAALPLKITPEVMFDFEANSKMTIGGGEKAGQAVSTKIPCVQYWGGVIANRPAQNWFLGMFDAATRFGVQLTCPIIKLNLGDAGQYDEVDDFLRENPADGYLVTAGRYRKLLKHECTIGKPVVVLDVGNFHDIDYPTVKFDIRQVLKKAFSKFRESGCRKVAMFVYDSDCNDPDYLARIHRIYKGALGEGGLDFELLLQVSELKSCYFEQEVDRLLDSGADALFVNDEFLLPYLAHEFRKRKIKPGRDIAVISASNSGFLPTPDFEWSRFEYDIYQFGFRAVLELSLLMRGMIDVPGRQLIDAEWIPGNTHKTVRRA